MADPKAAWRKVQFSEMVTSAGATRKSRGWNIEDAGVERYVGLEHLDSNSLAIRRWGDPRDVGENSDLRHFEVGDVLLARRGIELRKVGRAHFPGVASGHALVFRAVPEIVLPEFLPFFIQSDVFMSRADRRSVGSLSKTVNLSALMKEEFALPPLEEQRRVVRLLQGLEETKLSASEVFDKLEIVRLAALTELETEWERLYGRTRVEAPDGTAEKWVFTANELVGSGTQDRWCWCDPGGGVLAHKLHEVRRRFGGKG